MDYSRRIKPGVTPDGMVEIRLSGEFGKLTVYPDEWEAFVREVKKGKWDDLSQSS